MKKSLLPIIFVSAGLAVLSTSMTQARQKEFTLELLSSLQDSIRIDGETSDWLNQQIPINKKDNVSYAVLTDSSAVTILLVFQDMPTTMGVLRRGLNIFVDSKGRKNKTSGISFPLQQQRDSMRPAGGFNRDETFAEMEQHLEMIVKTAADSIAIFGCRQEFNGRFRKGQSSVQAALSKPGKDSLIIELKFPVNLLPDLPKPGKSISVGIEMNGAGEDAGFAPMMGAPGFDPPPMDMPPPPGFSGTGVDDHLEFWIKANWIK